MGKNVLILVNGVDVYEKYRNCKRKILGTHAKIGKCKWNDIYDSKEELLNDLLKLEITCTVDGYSYLDDFKKVIKMEVLLHKNK